MSIIIIIFVIKILKIGRDISQNICFKTAWLLDNRYRI